MGGCVCGGGGGGSVSWLKDRKTLGIYVAVVSAKLNINKNLNKK